MRVVVIKFGAIGDMVFTTPLLREVSRFASHVGVLTLPWSRAVYEHHPEVDRLHLFDPWRAQGFGRVKLAWRIVRELRRERYDLAVILHRSPLAPLLALLAGIRQRIGFAQRGGRLLLTGAVPFDGERHEVLRNLSVLEAIGREGALGSLVPRTEMFLPQETSLDPFFRKKAGADDSVIGLFPGGGVNPGMTFAYKRWPVEKFARLAQRLVADGHRVAIFGGREDEELCHAVQEAIGGVGYWGIGRSLAEFGRSVQRCALFVGGDTGPLHIAAAVGTPTLALFGPTDPRLVAPLGELHRVMRLELPCSPCYLHGKPGDCREEHRCMRELEVEAVWERVQEMIGQRSEGVGAQGMDEASGASDRENRREGESAEVRAALGGEA
ncbi:MAG TPA: lipopolysaccharide heptosyltransferase II [Bacilli bacterium]|nr:lipopolysaccharide heptosyltransferase II [Bacilli bacterium]